MVKKVLTIAGSDSGGGAGIQADIKTINSIGVYASSVITALTAQNTQGVQQIFDVNPQFVAKQIEVVLSDISADMIKIGMLSNTQIIESVAESLRQYPNIPIILDTVMIAKGGCPLLKNDAVESLKENLIKNAYLVTPNIPEAEILADMKINNVEDMKIASTKIIKQGAKNILLKGGHLQSETIYDVLCDANLDFKIFEHQKINSNNTHGTGCTLSSAIASYLAKGLSLKDAINHARDYVYNAITNAPKNIGTGHGPLCHFN